VKSAGPNRWCKALTISTAVEISPAVLSFVSPSAVAETISDRYFCRERVLISLRKVLRAEAAMPVRSRLMKAVFFLREESSEALTSKRPCYSSVYLRLQLFIRLAFLSSPHA
jgi:hypothetical protein